MQPAELHGLVAALVDSQEDSGPRLGAAAKQQLIPESLRAGPDWTRNIRIPHNNMMPNPVSGRQYLALPECKFSFLICHGSVKGMQCLHALRVLPQILA